ncbi:transcriptional regulator [uncultured Azohydromonas sp.]|jgi:Predicted transcriptional regulator|uniref:HVO_A0114 family putative DNA-binding protein n=1 Tax=uncultured Azohydromonas sp. TaxID=487342 RepID=UPI0026126340|nr:transcriptional regulator [uncultured Azohydromonas sp.]
MKAIIEVALRNSIFSAAARQLEQSRRGLEADFHLSFESARLLFSELTPARLELLNVLRGTGASTVYALVKAAERNYSNVHSDLARLVELGLIERDSDDKVFVPFDAVEIRLALAQAA